MKTADIIHLVKPLKNTVSTVVELLKIVFISLVIIVPIRYFIVQPFIVRGDSMVPNFHDGEYLIIDEISYRLNDPVRGEVVVFKFPQNPSQYYIKRIIGLPGEIVELKDGSVYITREGRTEKLVEEYLSSVATAGTLTLTLQEGEYFVLGDNRGASSDSRRWGALKETFLIGRVLVRAWPIERFGFFPSMVPEQ